mgnify:CR=1 FL=1
MDVIWRGFNRQGRVVIERRDHYATWYTVYHQAECVGREPSIVRVTVDVAVDPE